MTNGSWRPFLKEPFEVFYGRDEDIQFLLERAAKEGLEQPCPPG